MTHAQITNELLHDLIAEPISVIELCTRHALTVDELHAIITSPAFTRLAEMIRAIQQARESFTRARLAQVLERIALTEPTSPSHTETIRKAAAHLDRQLTKPTTETQDQPPPESDSDPTPDPTPDPDPDTEPDPSPDADHDEPNPTTPQHTPDPTPNTQQHASSPPEIHDHHTPPACPNANAPP
jgi:outer membrane biosynthesis protein TonB